MPRDIHDKILTRDELLNRRGIERREGKTLVHCHGCFDIVHPGHIRYLEFAKRQGDVLIVSLTGDSEISKGDHRPYIPQELRAESLAALVFVDYVYINPEPTSERLLEELRPDVYVKGREYEDSTDRGFLAEKGVVEGYGGRIIFSSGEIVFSSTALIAQSSPSAELEAQRLGVVCRRHGIDRATLDQTVSRFADLNVLVLGDVVMDNYVLCDALGVASEAPVMSLAERDRTSFVGGAAIVARHVAAMGAKTFLLSAGARDECTSTIKKTLADEGVETHLIDSRPSIVEKTRFLVDDAKVVKVDRGECLPLDSVAEREAAEILAAQSCKADAVIFCDFGYGMITGSLLSRVLPTLRQNVRTIAADVSGARANLLHYRHVDLLCPTEREARTMLNDYDSGLSAIAWAILNQTQARHIFITLEKKGLVSFERRTQDRQASEWSGRLRSEQLPSFADRTIDRLGCGDALLSAATLALAVGSSAMQAAYIGSAAAAIELAVLGNHPVGRPQLLEWLRTRPELAEGESLPVQKVMRRLSVERVSDPPKSHTPVA